MKTVVTCVYCENENIATCICNSVDLYVATVLRRIACGVHLVSSYHYVRNAS